MAKTIRPTAHHFGIGIPLALLGVNYLTGTVLDFPVVYCWLGPAAASLYYGWGMVVLYGVAFYLLFFLFTGRIKGVFFAALIGMAIIETPRLFVYLFKVGGACG